MGIDGIVAVARSLRRPCKHARCTRDLCAWTTVDFDDFEEFLTPSTNSSGILQNDSPSMSKHVQVMSHISPLPDTEQEV